MDFMEEVMATVVITTLLAVLIILLFTTTEVIMEVLHFLILFILAVFIDITDFTATHTDTGIEVIDSSEIIEDTLTLLEEEI